MFLFCTEIIHQKRMITELELMILPSIQIRPHGLVSIIVKSQKTFQLSLVLKVRLVHAYNFLTASFSMVGQYFPIFFVGPLVGKYGKRLSMMIDCFLFLIGFFLQSFSTNVIMLYVAKFFMGR